jgi:hypothetical protein
MASNKSREEKQVKIGQIWKHKEYDVLIKITKLREGCQVVHKTFKGPIHTRADFEVISSDYVDKNNRATFEHCWQLGNKVENRYSAHSIVKIWELANMDCHKCGNEMVAKRSAAGPFFWGCSTFPQCFGTQKIVNWPELLEQNDDYVTVEKRPGATCTSCKTHYPYADASSNFKCWGCENGY